MCKFELWSQQYKYDWYKIWFIVINYLNQRLQSKNLRLTLCKQRKIQKYAYQTLGVAFWRRKGLCWVISRLSSCRVANSPTVLQLPLRLQPHHAWPSQNDVTTITQTLYIGVNTPLSLKGQVCYLVYKWWYWLSMYSCKLKFLNS